MKNYVYAETTTKNNTVEHKGITSKQWQVYYYLLSISNFDAQRREDHRYVYKKDFNISAAAKFLGIGRQTIYRALNNLAEAGLVIERGQSYALYSKTWAPIEKDTLRGLLRFSKAASKNIDMLRLYLALKKLNQTAKSKAEKSFTRRDAVVLLGHGKSDTASYQDVKTYIILLTYFNLIEVKTHMEHSDSFGNYIVYHLQNVMETSDRADFEDSDILAEMNAPQLIPPHIYEEIRFKMPEMLD